MFMFFYRKKYGIYLDVFLSQFVDVVDGMVI
jgi:hypothetical protein